MFVEMRRCLLLVVLSNRRLVGAAMDHEEFPNGPVEDMVILEGFAHEQFAEQLAKIAVIRIAIKRQITDIFEVNCEFHWQVTAKFFDRSVQLLLFDPCVSLIIRRSRDIFPRQGSAGKVYHRITKRFEIITAGCLWIKLSRLFVISNLLTYQFRDGY